MVSSSQLDPCIISHLLCGRTNGRHDEREGKGRGDGLSHLPSPAQIRHRKRWTDCERQSWRDVAHVNYCSSRQECKLTMTAKLSINVWQISYPDIDVNNRYPVNKPSTSHSLLPMPATVTIM